MHKEPSLAFVVADGARARLLIRHSNGRYDEIDALEAEPSHRQGEDTRGRVFSSVGGARSALGEPDHDRAVHQFGRALAERIDRLCEADEIARYVLVAPPRLLAAIREGLSPRALERGVGELPKDLTKLPEAKLREALEQVSLRPVPMSAGRG